MQQSASEMAIGGRLTCFAFSSLCSADVEHTSTGDLGGQVRVALLHESTDAVCIALLVFGAVMQSLGMRSYG